MRVLVTGGAGFIGSHLAAAVDVRYSVEDPLADLVTNVRGTENVLVLSWKYWEKARRRVPDVERAVQKLGFRTTVPLEEELERAVAWFEERGLNAID